MTAIYVSSTRTVHLAEHDLSAYTLCRAKIQLAWEPGDETLSGLSATCRRCRHVLLTQSRPVL